MSSGFEEDGLNFRFKDCEAKPYLAAGEND
jgi:hypothetical protein